MSEKPAPDRTVTDFDGNSVHLPPKLLSFSIVFRLPVERASYEATAETLQQLTADFTAEGKLGGVYAVFVRSVAYPHTLALRFADMLYIG